MHEVILQLDGLDRTVVRPIVFSIIERIKHLLKLDDDIKVLMDSTLGEKQQVNSSENSSNDTVGKLLKVLLVDYTETYNQDYYGETPVGQMDFNPVLADHTAGFYVSPMYINSDLMINITYSDMSKNRLLKFINDYRLKISQNMNANLHNLKYRYILPDSAVRLLLEVHRLEEQQAGYGYDVQEFLAENSDNRLEWVSDTSGEKLEISINELQTRVIGIIDLEPSPSNVETDKEYYTVTMTYKVTYQKPIGVKLIYPTLVHNQMIDKDFIIETNLNKGMDDYYTTRNPTNKFLKGFETQFETWLSSPSPTIIIPPYDRWEGPAPIKYTARVATILAIVDQKTPNVLFNLKDLGDLSLNKDVLNWLIAGEYKYATSLFNSMLLFTIYKNNEPLAYTENLVLDANLNLTSVTPLDIRSNYHVCINIILDGSSLVDGAVNRLVANRAALLSLLQTINATIDSPEYMAHKKYDTPTAILAMSDSDIYKYIKTLTYNWSSYYSGTKRIQFSKILTINP